MALTPLATVADLEARLGQTLIEGTVDRARAEAALTDASALVRSESGRVYLDSDGSVNAPDPIVLVVIQAALRGFRNPDGFASENLGEYGYRLDAVGVYLTDEEKRIVNKARGGSWTGTGSIRTPSAYERGGSVVLYALTADGTGVVQTQMEPIPVEEV